MDQMEIAKLLGEAMETQRAIRRLKTDPVDDRLVLRLIELALKAPTSSNSQSWEFIIVKDPKVKQGLARLNRQLWRLYGRIGWWRTRRDPRRRKILSAVQWQADHFEEIPVIVVACLKGLYLPLLHISATSYFGSIYPSVQNSSAGCTRHEPRGRAHNHPVVERVGRPPSARSALEHHAVRCDPSGLAAGPLRPDDT